MKVALYFVTFEYWQAVELELLEGERVVNVENLSTARQVWIEGTVETRDARWPS